MRQDAYIATVGGDMSRNKSELMVNGLRLNATPRIKTFKWSEGYEGKEDGPSSRQSGEPGEDLARVRAQPPATNQIR